MLSLCAFNLIRYFQLFLTSCGCSRLIYRNRSDKNKKSHIFIIYSFSKAKQTKKQNTIYLCNDNDKFSLNCQFSFAEMYNSKLTPYCNFVLRQVKYQVSWLLFLYSGHHLSRSSRDTNKKSTYVKNRVM